MNNSITIIGHVGQNPTEKSFPSGKKVANFSVAVKEYGTAQKEAQPIWYDVQAWNGLGDSVLSHITRGREVVIQGKLMMNQYKDKKTNHVIIKPIINLTGYRLCGKKLLSAESKMEAESTTKKSHK